MKEKVLIFWKVFLFASITLLMILWGNLSYGYEWERTFGKSDYDTGYSVQQTTDGGYIVTGSTWSFGAGEEDVWVLKLNSDGSIAWQNFAPIPPTPGGSGR